MLDSKDDLAFLVLVSPLPKNWCFRLVPLCLASIATFEIVSGIAEACLKLLASSGLPSPASPTAGSTGAGHHTQPFYMFSEMKPLYFLWKFGWDLQ